MRVQSSLFAISTVFFALFTRQALGAQEVPQPTPQTSYTSPYLAKPFELATWEKSKKTPRTFTVPGQIAPLVLLKAQALILGWHERNKARQMMKIQVANDSTIETRTPNDASHFGLTVSCLKTPLTWEFTISGKSYQGNTFSLSGDSREADKRAELLSFLLQEYVRELEGAPATPKPLPSPALPPALPTQAKRQVRPEIYALLNRIRALLEAGETDAALAQLEQLKTLLQKGAPMP